MKEDHRECHPGQLRGMWCNSSDTELMTFADWEQGGELFQTYELDRP